ncbi:5'-deoxyadenosine deaminase [candidate division KSB1 bacterium]|nr:5'-deoxyadenosine deaminase [candidate division KSB1 bacterium]
MKLSGIKPTATRIKNGTLVTMNPRREILKTDLLIEGNRIIHIGTSSVKAGTEIDATDKVVLPGFVQTHTHLCQTLFRNLADDLSLLDWLQKRIWPLEAAHDEDSITLSAQLGIAELFKCGTTTILDMGTVQLTDLLFQEAQATGMRAIIGKALMDADNGIPVKLIEPTSQAMAEVLRLIRDWHNSNDTRLKFALAPRFLLSSSPELLYDVKALSQERNLLIHTHAAESRQEIEIITRQTGAGNIEYLCNCGLTGPQLCLAHCIWLNEDELKILQRTETKVLHCPSANLKLASGIALIPEMLERGIAVSLGADGAPCNNNLDIFMEMRLAALLQKYRQEDPKVLPAQKVVEMATIDGAFALGMDHEIGSLEEGKLADLIILDLNQIHTLPAQNIYAQMVYSARPENVQTVLVDGKMVMRDRELLTLDEEEIVKTCGDEAQRLLETL